MFTVLCYTLVKQRSDKSEFIEVFRMKQKVPMICNIVSLILLIVFVIKSIVDYTQYSTSLNSAPFYLWVLVNALFLVIPAIILFVIGLGQFTRNYTQTTKRGLLTTNKG